MIRRFAPVIAGLIAAAAPLAALEFTTDKLGRGTASGAAVVVDGVEGISPVKVVLEPGRAVTVGAKDRPALWLMLCATTKDLEEVGKTVDAGNPPLKPTPGCTLGWAVFNDRGRLSRRPVPWDGMTGMGMERTLMDARVAYARKVASETTVTTVTMNGPATPAAPGQPVLISSRETNTRTTTNDMVSGCKVVGLAFVEGGPFLALVEVDPHAPKAPRPASDPATKTKADADRVFADLDKAMEKELAKSATAPAAK